MMRLRESHIHLLGIIFFFVFDFIFYYGKVVSSLQISLPLFIVICAVFALHIWFFNYIVVSVVRRFYPGLHGNLRKRMIALALAIPVIVVLTTLFQSFFFGLLNQGPNMPLFYVHYEDVGMNLLYSLIIIFFLELLFYFSQWNRVTVEAAELKQETIQAQLKSLQHQVSPHFLFNSLNTLSSLIKAEPMQAVVFVQNMCVVYRYLLQSNGKNLVFVREEIDFLQSYLNLLHTRFGTALQCDIKIDAAKQHRLVPPFTLQLLVENAVKHNEVSAANPLWIAIESIGEQLVIRNNLQKRKSPVPSIGIGLTNIISKYQLISDNEVDICESDQEFIIRLPLLNG